MREDRADHGPKVKYIPELTVKVPFKTAAEDILLFFLNLCF